MIGARHLLEGFDYVDPDYLYDDIELLYVDLIEDENIRYMGQINEEGQRHGVGIEILEYCVYEGYWKYNQRSGLGRVIAINGDNYEGYWANDIKNGFGALWKTSGAGYVGEWDCDIPEGKGTEIWTLEIYEGDFHLGMRHGKGVLTQANLVFTGEFFKGMVSGYGVVKWPNNSAYAGIFIDGESKGLKGAFMPGYSKITLLPVPPSGKLTKKAGEIPVPAPSRINESFASIQSKDKLPAIPELNPGAQSALLLKEEYGRDLFNSVMPSNENEFNKPLSVSLRNNNIPEEKNIIQPQSNEKIPEIDGQFSISKSKDLDSSMDDGNNERGSRNNTMALIKGILRNDSSKKTKGIDFEQGFIELDEDEQQKKKAKFKSANKEKGVENVLKGSSKKHK